MIDPAPEPNAPSVVIKHDPPFVRQFILIAFVVTAILFSIPRVSLGEESQDDVRWRVIHLSGVDSYWEVQRAQEKRYGSAALAKEMANELIGRQKVVDETRAWLPTLANRKSVQKDVARAEAWLVHEQNIIVDLNAEIEALKARAALEAEGKAQEKAKLEREIEENAKQIDAQIKQRHDAEVARQNQLVRDERLKRKKSAANKRRRAHAKKPAVTDSDTGSEPSEDDDGDFDEDSHSRYILCCDGTRSPTCTYAHRGCCSWHGGVCGS